MREEAVITNLTKSRSKSGHFPMNNREPVKIFK
jgi:hypothetical protein